MCCCTISNPDFFGEIKKYSSKPVLFRIKSIYQIGQLIRSQSKQSEMSKEQDTRALFVKFLTTMRVTELLVNQLKKLTNLVLQDLTVSTNDLLSNAIKWFKYYVATRDHLRLVYNGTVGRKYMETKLKGFLVENEDNDFIFNGSIDHLQRFLVQV